MAWFRNRKRPSPPDASLIIPILKAAIESDGPAIELRLREQPIFEPYVADLLVSYVFDLPKSFQYVNRGDCERLALDPAALRGPAITNLRRRLPYAQRHGDWPAFLLTTGGNIESSLLLLDEFWDDQASTVPGEAVVAVPARDVILLTGRDSPEGLEALRASIERLQPVGDHLLTRSLLVRRGNRWEPLDDRTA